MSLHQSLEPTPHPTKVRATAYELALRDQVVSDRVYTTDVIRAAAIEKRAKEIETYLWGKFAPIEKAPTPLSTIDETLDHLDVQLRELVFGCADPVKAAKIDEVRPIVERLRSDLTNALEPGA